MGREPEAESRGPALARAAAWLRAGRGGMFLLALLVGAGAGLGAVAFRYLIYFFTWLATGQSQFGQDGRVGSSHLPWLGLGFFVVIPAIGGLLYGPLIYNWAREARGHGVPEVMIAVAEGGGRIRWQVALVKSLASALCIGSGGSVGREGPIVQIGSALASSVGQWVKLPENRIRIMVACGAAGGISATFNAPITGVFFGVEIILREFAVDALFTVMLSAAVADVVAIPFLGDKPFLSGFPAGIALGSARNYLLVVVLAVFAGLLGLAFKAVLYKVEDWCDALWKGRPEWARPAVLGLGFGLLLLALPQMYGVGYPVMFKATAGDYALWFLIVLALGKIVATSVTMGIGGSGGIFAPSLFIGVTGGYAYGDVVSHLFGPAAGPPALYAVIAMGAVFTAAARAPLTSLASVVEMTGDFSLTLPVMLAVAIATMVSRALSYGTIYTTKLLRRGTDIDQAAPWRALADLKITDVMRPFAPSLPVPPDPAAPRPPPRQRQLPRPGGGRRAAGRTTRPAGPVHLRVPRPDAAAARGLRARRPAGALPRRAPRGRLDHQRERAARARLPDRRSPGRRQRPRRRDRGRPAAPAGSAGRLRGRGDHDRCGLARGRAQAGRGHLAAGRHPGLAAARAAARPARPRRRAGRRRPGPPADPDAAGTGPAGPGRAAAGPCGRRRPGRRVA